MRKFFKRNDLIICTLVVITVVSTGVALGYYSSVQLSKKEEAPSALLQESVSSVNQAQAGKLKVRLEANLTTIKADSERSILSVYYQNNTSQDLTGVQIEIVSSTKTKFSTDSSNSIKFNKKAADANNHSTYDAPNVKVGQEMKVNALIYGSEPGVVTLRTLVKTKEGIQGSSQPISITIQ